MPIGFFNLTGTTNAWGGGTFTSSRAITGEIVHVRLPLAGTAWTLAGSTADFTITEGLTGGTIIALTNVNAPFEYLPRKPISTDLGGTLAVSLGGSAVYDQNGIAVAGTVTMIVAQCQQTIAGTAVVYYRR